MNRRLTSVACMKQGRVMMVNTELVMVMNLTSFLVE